MSVRGRPAPLLLLFGALALLGVGCGSATLRTDGGTGAAGRAGTGGTAGRAGVGGAGGGAAAAPCVLDSTQVDNCSLQ
jgi:hypothetical protein